MSKMQLKMSFPLVISVWEFMELLAVFEASTREMLPKKYKDMDSQEVIERWML